MLIPLLVFLSVPILSTSAIEFSEDDFFEINVDRDHPEKLYKEFEAFKIKYKRKYKNAAENQMRMQNFVKTHNSVQKLNKDSQKNGHDTQFGINKFSDLSAKEFKALLSHYPPTMTYDNHTSHSFNFMKHRQKRDVDDLPKKIDLRWERVNGHKVVGPVKDQGNCACCWAFAMTAVAEAVYALHIGEFNAFSEQELCDCATNGTLGCSGGDLEWGASYIMGKGLSTQIDYGYEQTRAAKTGMCEADKKEKIFPAGRLVYVKMFPHQVDGDFLAVLVHFKTPIAVSFAVGKAFETYELGILETQDCFHEGHLWHAGAIVGYGEEMNKYGIMKKFWIVKNSWGPEDWGQKGYFKVIRGKNWCNIEMKAVAATLEEYTHGG